MPNPNPKHRFKAGNNLNPLGAGAHDQKIKALRKFTSDQLRDCVEDFMHKTVQEIEMIANDKYASAHRGTFAKILLKAWTHGDAEKLEIILCRIMGKVPDRLADADGGSLLKGLAGLYAGLGEGEPDKKS